VRQHGYALPVLIGITALSIAACGSSPTPSTSSPQASGTTSATAAPTSGTSQPSKGGKDHVAGLITSVTGNTLAVSDNNVTSTVGFSSATKVSEMTPAALTDITVGSCVSVRPARGAAPASDGSVAAAAIVVSAPRDGQCFTGGRQPAGSRTAPGGHASHGGIRGTVASVGGSTMVVTAAGSTTPTNVTLSDTTTYAKRGAAGIQAIAQGKCVNARGTTDGADSLQADMIALRPANNGGCPSMHH
jgi:hypothetical protein